MSAFYPYWKSVWPFCRADLLAAHLTELWQESDQGEGQRRTHAAHRGQQFIALRENDVGSDYLGQAFVEQMDIGLKPREATFVEAPQYSILNMSGLVLDRELRLGLPSRYLS